MSTFSPQKLKQVRRASGVSREQLARACDLSFYTITDWEQGKTTPRLNNLDAAAAALGVRVTDFFEDAPDA